MPAAIWAGGVVWIQVFDLDLLQPSQHRFRSPSGGGGPLPSFGRFALPKAPPAIDHDRQKGNNAKDRRRRGEKQDPLQDILSFLA